MDQLRPFPVVHQGQLGAHAFIVWAQERPSTSDVTLILQSHVKEVTEEDVTVHPCLAQDEVASIAFHTRLPDWLCDRSTAEREWR